MAPHSSTLAWKILWTEEPGRLQSMRSLRVRHDWATSLSLFTFMHWRRKCNPLQRSCPENPRDGGAWWAAIYGVAQSRTRLKRLSSSSSSRHLISPSVWTSGVGLVAKSYGTLCDPMDCNPLGFSVYRIPQARILEWVAISFSKGSSQPRNWTYISCLAGGFSTTEPLMCLKSHETSTLS